MREPFHYPTLPTIGRIVHVVRPIDNERFPAIVLHVHTPDDPDSQLDLGVFGHTYEVWPMVWPISHKAEVGWEWPPR